MIPFPNITEATARSLIANGLAGYWEFSFRDSISKSPIAHGLQTAIFLSGEWYLVPVSDFVITDLGRHEFSPGMTFRAGTVTCNNMALCLALNEEVARLGKKMRV